jgi:uncharacterized membrane protein
MQSEYVLSIVGYVLAVVGFLIVFSGGLIAYIFRKHVEDNRDMFCKNREDHRRIYDILREISK